MLTVTDIGSATITKQIVESFVLCLKCYDTVDWTAGRPSGL